MALAGYCRGCGQYVWLNDQWGCVNGHPWTEISNWYETQSGAPVTPYWVQPAPSVAPVAPAPAAPAAIPIAPVAAAPAPAPVPVVEPAPAAAVPVAVPMPIPPASPEAAPVSEPTVAPTAPETVVVPVAVEPAQSSRLELLADILATLGQYPNYVAHYGTDTDIVIGNEIADASWGTGQKKVEYSAILKADEAQRTVVYWELIKESSSGLNFGSFDAEATTTVGLQRSGNKAEAIIGPNGVAMDADWDYAATRSIVESVVARHGWRLESVVRKSSAQW